MDFRLTEEQRLMVDTARRVGESFGLDYWREIDAEKAFPTAYWKAVCDAGLCGVALPEEHGGAGLGMLHLTMVLEELGRGLVPVPFASAALAAMAAGMLLKTDALAPHVSGERRITLALTEAHGRFEPEIGRAHV